MATPEYTPKRKRRLADDIFGLVPLQSSDRFNFGLLLPLPMKVGSGRQRKDAGHLHQSLGLLMLPDAHHKFILQISTDFHFEEDDDPTTPGGQVISEKLVNQWHGTLFKGVSDDDMSDEETLVLKNPFLGDDDDAVINKRPVVKHKSNPFAESDDEVDYSTHLELYNHRTGERKQVRLTAAQQKIKPKRLDFSNI